MNDILFISDLDGTLLDKNKRIPDRVIRALERFVKAGGSFTVATGRTEDTCRFATEILPVNAPMILYNGACIMERDSGKVLYDRTLDAGAFRPLAEELMERFPELCLQIFAYGPLILVNDKGTEDPYITGENQPFRRMGIRETPDRWLKMMLSAPPERLREIKAFIDSVKEGYPPYTGFFSADHYYELLPENCGKGEAARWLAGYMGLPMERVAAMGDHENDVELLRAAGISFAPSNAHESAKAAAGRVLRKSCDEGAAEQAAELLTNAE